SDNRAKAEELTGWIESVPPGLRPPSLMAYAHRARARLAADAEAGADHFRAAAATFRELGMPFWLAVSLLEHAEALAADGRPSEAEPPLAEAREIFERLRARTWLERAGAIRGDRSAEAVG